MNTQRITHNSILLIKNVKYIQKPTLHLNVGDLVLDTRDNCYAIIDFISPDNSIVTLRDGAYVEIGVNIHSVILLKPLT